MNAIIANKAEEINSNSHNEKMLKSALAYAKFLNWHVFPVHSLNSGQCTCGNANCKQVAKHPITYNGLKSATNDLKTIEKWWGKQFPGAGIGVRTGKESGIFVLDVDIHKVDGKQTLENLVEKQGADLPDTVQSITGSGGNHYVFTYQDGVGNKVNFAPGLDIRGDGGYIIAPPSIHQTSSRYEWELSSRPLDVAIAEAPEWLIGMIKQPTAANGAKITVQPSTHWQNLMQGLAEGEGRNNAATSLVGHLLSKRVDLLLAYELLHLWNEKNNPPMDRSELDRIIASIARKEVDRRGKR